MKWFSKRISQQRATEWIDLLTQGQVDPLIEQIKRYPRTITRAKLPL